MKENKNRILVFGGTVEGRQVSDFLSSQAVFHTLCVATEYGEEVLTPGPYMQVHMGRLTREQMQEFMMKGGFVAVIDATHPYAVEVSGNIRAACEAVSMQYLRYLRPGAAVKDLETSRSLRTVMVNSAKEAARYLETQQGQIFLTTGSKELHVFTELISDKSRLFARVLPSAEVIASCRALGLEGKQICGMQGPFSKDINVAMMRQTKAAFLVTKDTGISGGFPEKIEAAAALDVQAVIIRRPEEAGLGWETLTEEITRIIRGMQDGMVNVQSCRMETEPEKEQEKEREQERESRQISCIGIGMGTLETLTHESAEAIAEADILFGAKRILESVQRMLPEIRSMYPGRGNEKQAAVTEYMGSRISDYLEEHPGYRKIVVLMSGDVGFYSGARGIEKAFPKDQVRFYCGISSVVYFASKIPTAWQDAKLVSAHGKELAVLNHVSRYPKIITLVSGREDVERICAELKGAGLNQVRVTVGSNLSYPEECIRSGVPEDFLKCETRGLHIMMLENPDAGFVVTPGIPDDRFIRGKVPMTKEEIRILSIAKLQLTEDAVVYDVGAGTGSVSIEAARLCTGGRVYAIERNTEGIELIRENCRKMCLSNVVAVEGTAPEALQELPVPSHAFIGGSSGNMRRIIETLQEKNREIRIVINTIALESIGETMQILKELEIEDADIVQISAAKSRVLGRYHMMTGLNPVYIISFGGAGYREKD